MEGGQARPGPLGVRPRPGALRRELTLQSPKESAPRAETWGTSPGRAGGGNEAGTGGLAGAAWPGSRVSARWRLRGQRPLRAQRARPESPKLTTPGPVAPCFWNVVSFGGGGFTSLDFCKALLDKPSFCPLEKGICLRLGQHLVPLRKLVSRAASQEGPLVRVGLALLNLVTKETQLRAQEADTEPSWGALHTPGPWVAREPPARLSAS